MEIIGILNKANQSKEKTEEAQELEGINLAISTSRIDDSSTKFTKSQLENNLKIYFNGKKDFEITDNNDSSFMVKFNKSNREYYIDESGSVIKDDKILKISDFNDLNKFRDEVNSGNTYEGWYVYLTNDIVIDTEEQWVPIGIYNENGEEFLWGYKGYSFKGIFDGKNHIINKLYINDSGRGRGLFGFVTYATIKNIELGDQCAINSGNETGGIVGNAFSSNILNCINKSSILSSGYGVGGIVGVSNFCKISNCRNSSTVETTQFHIGGIVGNAYSSNIFQCGNNGKINGDTSIAGGIIGQCNYNQIDECYNIGKVSSNYGQVGGIAGNVTGNLKKISTINNSYNMSEISGRIGIGGIIGCGENLCLTNSYNVGKINGSGNTGEIIALKKENVKMYNNFYLDSCIDISNKVEGSTQKTYEEMKEIYYLLGNCFMKDVNNINNGYPVLTWQYK